MLLGVLLTMALMGVVLMAAAEVTATARQREREQELLFVGEQYRQAIERYWWAAPPGTPRTLPAGVEQLLHDDRYPQPVQHLRRAYADPFQAAGLGEGWVWVRRDGRLAGLHSSAPVPTLKRAHFTPRLAAFTMASEVSQWVFQFTPPVPAATLRPPGGTAPPPPQRAAPPPRTP
jgi:type II secretory pathway pseudopilin PulG